MWKYLFYAIFLASNVYAQNPSITATVTMSQPSLTGAKERIFGMTITASNGNGKVQGTISFKEAPEAGVATLPFIFSEVESPNDDFKIKRTFDYRIELPKNREAEVINLINRISREKSLREKGTKKDGYKILSAILGSNPNEKPFDALSDFFYKFK